MSLSAVEKRVGVETRPIVRPNEILFEDKEIPLPRLISHALANKGELIVKAKEYEQAYLRWQQVRYGGIPLDPRKPNERFTCGTGFEAYFYGEVKTQEDLLWAVLGVGKQVCEYINIPRKFSDLQKDKLFKVLGGKSYDKEPILYWHTMFGNILARMRAKLLINKQAQKFQANTRANCGRYIDFHFNEFSGACTQSYILPIKNISTTNISFTPNNEEEKRWYEVVQNIGIFGNPLVRAAIKSKYS